MTQYTLRDFEVADASTGSQAPDEGMTEQSSLFETGDRVLDEQDPDGAAIVLDAAVGRADEITVTGSDTTVAAFATNEAYPNDDPVVCVVYEAWLDRHAPGWREQPSEDLLRWLAAFVEEWDLPLQTYDYPASRLQPANASE